MKENEYETMKATRQNFFEEHGKVVETWKDHDDEYDVDGIRYIFEDGAAWTECKDGGGFEYYGLVIGKRGGYEEVQRGFIWNINE